MTTYVRDEQTAMAMVPYVYGAPDGLVSVRWVHDPERPQVYCKDCGHREFANCQSIAGHNAWHNALDGQPRE